MEAVEKEMNFERLAMQEEVIRENELEKMEEQEILDEKEKKECLERDL